ncbi:hypothetical protein [Natronobeatus ordinarius]|uniref:hypothetical protein n=1 Tax=Natronobeatus ordinarius TaxID=2963433 RepID=UPI0020CE2461|nr:hypothetical protein [Natronobeatus ordinarius]
MVRECSTSQAGLHEDTDGVERPMTDAEPEVIVRTEAHLAHSAAQLSDPVSPTVGSGPRETQCEQLDAEFLSDRVAGPVDNRRLRRGGLESRASSDGVDTRSSDLKAVLTSPTEASEKSNLEVRSTFERDALGGGR